VFWFTYNLFFHAAYLLMLPHFLLRMRRRGGYRSGFGERLFRLSEDTRTRLSEGRRLWVHAVSVGELQVGLAFMHEWRQRHPDCRFLLTVNTSTARKMARSAISSDDILLYPPVDSPLVLRPMLRLFRPSALVLVETEIWPNLLRRLHRDGVPVLLLNGRLSDRSYSRLRHLRALTRRVYPLVSRFCMQSEADAARMRVLGAPPDAVRVLHSVKYDVARPDPAAEALRRERLLRGGFLRDGDPILLGSSTWPGEEEALISIYKDLRVEFPALRLVLVPRHAERAHEAEDALRKAGISWTRWSSFGPGEVLLVDTTGELRHFSGLADWVFVGKSLFRPEGQNPLEAAAAGACVLTGPGMDNFRPVMADLRGEDAVVEVADTAALRKALTEALRDPAAAKARGNRARALVDARRGAVARSADELEKMLFT
jgi:3-deoxy-D-manno-octulosonic-acid transferase